MAAPGCTWLHARIKAGARAAPANPPALAAAAAAAAAAAGRSGCDAEELGSRGRIRSGRAIAGPLIHRPATPGAPEGAADSPISRCCSPFCCFVHRGYDPLSCPASSSALAAPLPQLSTMPPTTRRARRQLLMGAIAPGATFTGQPDTSSGCGTGSNRYVHSGEPS